MYKLADPIWWRALAGALVRTLIAALAPFAAQVMADANVMTQAAWWETMALVGGLAVVLAVGTALAGLPDPTGAWWEIALQRALRQAGQYLLAAAAGAVLLSDLGPEIWIGAAGSAVATFILAAMSLGVDPTAIDIEAAVAALSDPTSQDMSTRSASTSSASPAVGADGELDTDSETEDGSTEAPSPVAVDAAGFPIE